MLMMYNVPPTFTGDEFLLVATRRSAACHTNHQQAPRSYEIHGVTSL